MEATQYAAVVARLGGGKSGGFVARYIADNGDTLTFADKAGVQFDIAASDLIRLSVVPFAVAKTAGFKAA